MILIAGLGNPGVKYAKNRHNLGFVVVDRFAKAQGVSWRFNPDWMAYYVKSADFVLVKPSTYMNKSGEAVRSAANFYNIQHGNIIIVHDDLDLELGKIRLSFGGSAAGHHGIESVIASMGTNDFARLRVGIGHPSDGDAESFVLQDFGPEEEPKLGQIIRKCQEALRSYLEMGIEATMNQYN